MSILADIEWDTPLVLTVLLAPLCVVLIGVIFSQMSATNKFKKDKDAAVAELREFQKAMTIKESSFADAIAKRDAEIKREQDDIVKLHADLETLPTLKASLKEQSHLLNRIRQLEADKADCERQLQARHLGGGLWGF